MKLPITTGRLIVRRKGFERTFTNIFVMKKSCVLNLIMRSVLKKQRKALNGGFLPMRFLQLN